MTGSPINIFEIPPLPEQDHRLVDLYIRAARAVDELAYTEEFEEIYRWLAEAGDTRSRAEVFRRLLNLRKAG
jgi:hypothetical protein